MFMNGTVGQWLELGEYCLIMIALGVFVACISMYLSNWMLKEEVRKDKLYQVKKNKNKKKQVFFDVA